MRFELAFLAKLEILVVLKQRYSIAWRSDVFQHVPPLMKQGLISKLQNVLQSSSALKLR